MDPPASKSSSFYIIGGAILVLILFTLAWKLQEKSRDVDEIKAAQISFMEESFRNIDEAKSEALRKVRDVSSEISEVKTAVAQVPVAPIGYVSSMGGLPLPSQPKLPRQIGYIETQDPNDSVIYPLYQDVYRRDGTGLPVKNQYIYYATTNTGVNIVVAESLKQRINEGTILDIPTLGLTGSNKGVIHFNPGEPVFLPE